MSEQWKYSRDGQLKAGVTRGEIARMVAAGELGDDDSVFSSSLKTWQPVSAVREMLLQAPEPAATAASPAADGKSGEPRDSAVAESSQLPQESDGAMAAPHGDGVAQETVPTATETAACAETGEPAGPRGEHNGRATRGKPTSKRLNEMMAAYGGVRQAVSVPRNPPPPPKTASRWKWGVVAGAALVGVILAAAMWPRENWESEHRAEVVSLFEQGEGFYSSRRYVEAVEKYARLVEMIGARSLGDARLRGIAQSVPGRLESARSAARRSEQLAEQDRMPAQPRPVPASVSPPSAAVSTAAPAGARSQSPGAVPPGFRRTVLPDGPAVVVPIEDGQALTPPPGLMSPLAVAQPGATDAGTGFPLPRAAPAAAAAVSQVAVTPTPAATPIMAPAVTGLPEGKFWTMVLPLGMGLSVPHDGLAQVEGVRAGKNPQSLKIAVTARGPLVRVEVQGMDPIKLTLKTLAGFRINSALREVFVEKADPSLDQVNVELLGSGARVIGRLKLASPKSDARVKAYVTTEKALDTARTTLAASSQALQRATAAYNARVERAGSSYLRASERASLDDERDRVAEMRAGVSALGVQCQQLATAFQKCRDTCIRMVDEEGLQALERQEVLRRQREELSAKLPVAKRKFDEADIKSANMPDATARSQWLDRAVVARDELSALRQELSTVEAELSILDAKLEPTR